ncbi:MAG: hypothetical protein PVH84_03345 [Candidatus Aminicenantes bacterium]
MIGSILRTTIRVEGKDRSDYNRRMIESSKPGICSREFCSVCPPCGSFSEGIEECLGSLEEKAKATGQDLSCVLMQTFFIRAEDKNDYSRMKNLGTSILQKFYQSDIPATSFIAQHPEEGKEVSLDAILRSHPEAGKIYHKNCEGIPYTLLDTPVFTEVYAGGLANHPDQSYTPAQYREGFGSLKKILRSEGMVFSDIVRQWNYIEKFLAISSSREGVRQNYQIFNDFRSLFYGEADFKTGYPASTGIGMFTGGVVLECIAMKSDSDVFIAPLSNPLQTDAHAYSQDILEGDTGRGFEKKAPPLFERAKIVSQGSSGLIFVSGTAAVRGEDTILEQDIRSQTLATVENIDTLISADNLSSIGVDIGVHSSRLSQLRAYVKRDGDLPLVKKICKDRYGDIPSQYVVSDVCRESLLVEIEGTACVPIRGIQNHRNK